VSWSEKGGGGGGEKRPNRCIGMFAIIASSYGFGRTWRKEGGKKGGEKEEECRVQRAISAIYCSFNIGYSITASQMMSMSLAIIAGERKEGVCRGEKKGGEESRRERWSDIAGLRPSLTSATYSSLY